MAEGKNWRKTFAYSKRDSATNEWWESQENPSVSLQLLIREDIERNGFTDKLNAPVTQQPRRGRPPKEEKDDGGSSESNQSRDSEPEAPSQTPSPTVSPAPPKAPPLPRKPAQRPKDESAAHQPQPTQSDEASVSAADDILGRL